MSERPKKGERYRHCVLRGTWRVRSCGEKETILDCNIPWLKPTVAPTQAFVKDKNWELVK